MHRSTPLSTGLGKKRAHREELLLSRRCRVGGCDGRMGGGALEIAGSELVPKAGLSWKAEGCIWWLTDELSEARKSSGSWGTFGQRYCRETVLVGGAGRWLERRSVGPWNEPP
jgi:hypothetical protein